MFELLQTRKHENTMEVFSTISLPADTEVSHQDIRLALQIKDARKFVIGYEETITANGLNRHYHAYSEHPIITWSKFQKQLRYQFHKLNIKKCKIENVRDSENAIKYCLKDGNFIYSGFEDGEISKYKSESYEKPLPFTKQLLQLEQLASGSKISVKESISRYIQIHKKCGINFTEFKINGWMTRIKCLRDPQFEENLVEKISNAFRSPEKNYLDQIKSYKSCPTKDAWLKASTAALEVMLGRDTGGNQTTSILQDKLGKV